MPQPIVELHVAGAGDELAFTPSHLQCTSGARVRIVFTHGGEILSAAHDWVLLKPGTKQVFLADALKHEDIGVPFDRSMVMASTGVCNKGQTVTVEFVAPAPGVYTYVCSVPGHGETMQGTLTVT